MIRSVGWLLLLLSYVARIQKSTVHRMKDNKCQKKKELAAALQQDPGLRMYAYW